MPPSSVSGCCFASAVAYLLWKCWSGALTACGWAWACWRQRWSQCASPADLCWGWRERRRSSRWMHPHHWPPGEREGLTRTDRIRGKVGGKKRREDSKKKKKKQQQGRQNQVNLGKIWCGQNYPLTNNTTNHHEKNYINWRFFTYSRGGFKCGLWISGSYLVNVNRGDRCSGDWWVAGRVWEWFAWTNRELLLFPHGHNLLGNWRQTHSKIRSTSPVSQPWESF